MGYNPQLTYHGGVRTGAGPEEVGQPPPAFAPSAGPHQETVKRRGEKGREGEFGSRRKDFGVGHLAKR